MFCDGVRVEFENRGPSGQSRYDSVYVLSVSPGGEDGPEAAHRVRRIQRVQQSPAHHSRQHSGQQERFLIPSLFKWLSFRLIL